MGCNGVVMMVMMGTDCSPQERRGCDWPARNMVANHNLCWILGIDVAWIGRGWRGWRGWMWMWMWVKVECVGESHCRSKLWAAGRTKDSTSLGTLTMQNVHLEHSNYVRFFFLSFFFSFWTGKLSAWLPRLPPVCLTGGPATGARWAIEQS
jgi:hypothetical protein